EVLGSVLKAEPDWALLPVSTPAMIRSLLRRCLRKDRKRRLHDIGDARIEIEEALSEPADAVPRATGRNGLGRLTWAVSLMLVGIAAAWAGFSLRRVPLASPEARLQIVTGPQNVNESLAISPDGLKFVFSATVAGKNQLWLRPIESETAQPLNGT